MSILGQARVIFTAETADAHRGIAEVESAYTGATRSITSNLERQSSSTLKVALAQRRYQDAIRRSGSESSAAISALIRLKDAEARVASETSHAARQTASASTAFGHFAHDVERAGLGIAVGTRAVHGLRSALIFGGISSVATLGFGQVLRSARDAAVEQQTALSQLQVALKDAGIAQSAYTGTVREGLDAMEKLGFDDEDAAKAMALTVRATKDVTSAQRLQSTAADVARGRNMSLVSATQLLVRVQAGQVGSLRRLGINVEKGISGTKALAEVQRQYAGAAAEFASSAEGSQQRFNVALHNTEATIGRALLPTITQLNGRLSNWLQNSRNQEHIQHDVNAAVSAGAKVVRGIGNAYQALAPPIRQVNRLLGGFENTAKLLGVALVGMKLRNIANDMGLLRARTVQAGAAAKISAAEFDALAAGEERAAVAGTGVRGGIGAGGAFGTALAIGIAGQYTAQGGQALSAFLGRTIGHGVGDTPLPPGVSFNDLVTARKHANSGQLTSRDRQVLRALGLSPAQINQVAPPLPKGGSPVPHYPSANDTATTTRRRPLTLQGRFNLAALRLAQASLTPDTADDVRYLNQEASILRKEIAGEKNLQKKTDLVNQLQGVLGQLQQISDSKQKSIDDKAHKAKEARAKRLEQQKKAARAKEKALNDRIAALYKEDISGSLSNANQALKDRSEYLNKKYGLGLAGAAASKKATQALTAADIRAEVRSGVNTLQEIIGNESNFTAVGLLKQIHTRLFQSENHLRVIRHVQVATVDSDRTFGARQAHTSTQAAFA